MLQISHAQRLKCNKKRICFAWYLFFTNFAAIPSAHSLGRWEKIFEKDVYERYLEVFKSRKFDNHLLRYGNGGVHFGRLYHPTYDREAMGNGRL